MNGKRFSVSLFAAVLSALCLTPTAVQAAATPAPAPTWGQAAVTVTFDDAYASAATIAAPLLQENGLKGTFFVNTEGPNAQNPAYLSWAQIQALQDTYGFEVGNHAYSHVDLSTLSQAEVRNQITRAYDDLRNHGIAVDSFATPYGAFNNTVNNEIARLHSSHRTSWSVPNGWPIPTYDLRAMIINPSISVATVKSWVDSAIANNQWLIINFHDIVQSGPTGYQYTAADLEQVLSYIRSKNVPVGTVRDVVNTWGNGASVVPNGSFESGTSTEASNWTRSSSKVALSTNSSGAYPAPARHMKIDTTSKVNVNTGITSSRFGVNAASQYRFKAFVRVTNRTAGAASFQIKEYNAGGAVIGTKTLATVGGNQIENVFSDYTPSVGTSTIQVLIFNNANAKLRTEVDSVELKLR